MQFLTSLFGGSSNMWLTALFALGAVIVLIFLVMWLLRLLTGGRDIGGRGRNRRLAVVDSLVVDQRRQLLIVRRDNVEHLILTGGPSDVVVETGIPVPETAMRPAAAPRRAPAPVRPAAPRVGAAPPVAAPATPVLSPVPEAPAVDPSSNVSPLDRLRAAAGGRRPAPRHPGLRDEPVLPQEAAVSPALPVRDSVKDESQDNGGEEAGSDDLAQAEAEGRARDEG